MTDKTILQLLVEHLPEFANRPKDWHMMLPDAIAFLNKAIIKKQKEGLTIDEWAIRKPLFNLIKLNWFNKDTNSSSVLNEIEQFEQLLQVLRDMKVLDDGNQ